MIEQHLLLLKTTKMKDKKNENENLRMAIYVVQLGYRMIT